MDALARTFQRKHWWLPNHHPTRSGAKGGVPQALPYEFPKRKEEQPAPAAKAAQRRGIEPVGVKKERSPSRSRSRQTGRGQGRRREAQEARIRKLEDRRTELEEARKRDEAARKSGGGKSLGKAQGRVPSRSRSKDSQERMAALQRGRGHPERDQADLGRRGDPDDHVERG